MNALFFIASRLRKTDKKTFTILAQRVGKLSVGLGLGALLLAFLIINGFEKNIYHRLTHFQGQMQIFKYSMNRAVEEIPIPNDAVSKLQEAFPLIDKITAFAHKAVLLQNKENLEGLICKGIDLQSNPDEIYQLYISEGRCILPAIEKPYSQEIILSTKLAAKLKVAVGDTLVACVIQPTLRYRKLTLVGLYTTFIEEIDEKIALCDLRLLQRLNGWSNSQVGGYDIYLQTDYAKPYLVDSLLDWLDYDLDVKTLEQAYPTIFDWIGLMKKDTFILLTLILIVANSNIICIILIQLMERARTIGLLKAMGASNKLIHGVLLWNNARVIFAGMFWGNLVGLSIAKLQAIFKFFRLNPTYYYLSYVPIEWNWKMILLLNLFLMALVWLVLLVSIAIIARARPIDGITLRQV